MYRPKFCLYGYGEASRRHIRSINYIGGDVHCVVDPPLDLKPSQNKIRECEYAVICSPTYLHREQTLEALSLGCKVIVEKPAVLPWEPLVDSDDVSVVLQLRYADLPRFADKVKVRFVRDSNYLDSWKGDPKKTGGLFYNLFIHYIDLAIRLEADFDGLVARDGPSFRSVQSDGQLFDLLYIDSQELYDNMYADIVTGKGVRPRELYYLHYILRRYSEMHGYTAGKRILIPKEML